MYQFLKHFFHFDFILQVILTHTNSQFTIYLVAQFSMLHLHQVHKKSHPFFHFPWFTTLCLFFALLEVSIIFIGHLDICKRLFVFLHRNPIICAKCMSPTLVWLTATVYIETNFLYTCMSRVKHNAQFAVYMYMSF